MAKNSSYNPHDQGPFEEPSWGYTEQAPTQPNWGYTAPAQDISYAGGSPTIESASATTDTANNRAGYKPFVIFFAAIAIVVLLLFGLVQWSIWAMESSIAYLEGVNSSSTTEPLPFQDGGEGYNWNYGDSYGWNYGDSYDRDELEWLYDELRNYDLNSLNEDELEELLSYLFNGGSYPDSLGDTDALSNRFGIPRTQRDTSPNTSSGSAYERPLTLNEFLALDFDFYEESIASEFDAEELQRLSLEPADIRAELEHVLALDTEATTHIRELMRQARLKPEQAPELLAEAYQYAQDTAEAFEELANAYQKSGDTELAWRELTSAALSAKLRWDDISLILDMGLHYENSSATSLAMYDRWLEEDTQYCAETLEYVCEIARS